MAYFSFNAKSRILTQTFHLNMFDLFQNLLCIEKPSIHKKRDSYSTSGLRQFENFEKLEPFLVLKKIHVTQYEFYDDLNLRLYVIHFSNKLPISKEIF